MRPSSQTAVCPTLTGKERPDLPIKKSILKNRADPTDFSRRATVCNSYH